MLKQFIFFGSVLLLTSCGGWTDKEKASFIEKCEKTKFNTEFCDCALENAIQKFDSFDSALESEVEYGKLFIDCIDKDRTEKE